MRTRISSIKRVLAWTHIILLALSLSLVACSKRQALKELPVFPFKVAKAVSIMEAESLKTSDPNRFQKVVLTDENNGAG